MENKIYFTAGEKSYNITENVASSETRFDWVEMRKNMLRRMTLSLSMSLLCHLLHVASRSRGRSVKKWKLREHWAEPLNNFVHRKEEV